MVLFSLDKIVNFHDLLLLMINRYVIKLKLKRRGTKIVEEVIGKRKSEGVLSFRGRDNFCDGFCLVFFT